MFCNLLILRSPKSISDKLPVLTSYFSSTTCSRTVRTARSSAMPEKNRRLEADPFRPFRPTRIIPRGYPCGPASTRHRSVCRAGANREARGQPNLRSLFFSTGHLFERYNHSQQNDDADQDVPDCRPRMRLSGDELETPQVALRPTGLIFNHCFERLGRKSAGRFVKRDRDAATVRMLVPLMAAPAGGAQIEAVTNQSGDNFSSRERAKGA